MKHVCHSDVGLVMFYIFDSSTAVMVLGNSNLCFLRYVSPMELILLFSSIFDCLYIGQNLGTVPYVLSLRFPFKI